jgi:hypothetical protein
MLRGSWRVAFWALLFLVVASCSGGGCTSGCAGCGITPLAGGLPKANVIENAAAVRLTRPGLDFLGNNIGLLAGKLLSSGATNAGVIEFPIPTSHSSQNFTIFSVDLDICPQGPDANSTPKKCIAEIDVGHAKLHLDSVTQFVNGGTTIKEPGILVSGTIPVRVQDLPVHIKVIGINLNPEIGVGTGDCSSGKPGHDGQGGFDYRDFPITIFLPLVRESVSPRDGYTKIDSKNAIINPAITSGDVALCEDCTALPVIGQPICNAVFGFIKDAAFGSLIGGITGQLQSAIAGATCTKPNAATDPSCPVGSHSDAPDGGASGTCVYDSDAKTCVPLMLGLDGHMNLGGLLKSISPGTTGGLDFALAATGDMDPAPGQPLDGNGRTPNGVTLGMFGGTVAQPQSTCVPLAPNPVPTGIPVPDELIRDKQTPWDASDPSGPHLGISLAGRFLNYAMGGLYNSGFLCLGVSTENFAQLNSGLLSVLIPSIKKLTFEQHGAAAAITTRPQMPPTIVLGTGKDLNKDPLLAVTLPRFAIDFYIWSYDRFVRAFTLTSDITVPVNLQTAKSAKNPSGGLLPVIGDLVIKNGVVTNNDLLTDDPAQMATGLSSILAGISGQLIGSLSAIDLSGALSSTGLTLTIPDGGIRKLSKGSDDFLGIFADLGVPATTTPLLPEMKTFARLLDKSVHAEAMGLTTADATKMPALHLAFDSSVARAGMPAEYAWRIDEGTWSAWSPDGDVTLRTAALFLQGKHQLHVASRVAGRPGTEDATPAVVPFTIDTLAPFVTLTHVEHDSPYVVDAWDIVSDASALLGRVRLTGADGRVGSWSEWAPLASMRAIDRAAVAADVEVRDEEGNVASVSQPLIRGHIDTTLNNAASGTGCGCSTPGKTPRGSSSGLAAGLLLLAGLAVAALRRRAGHSVASSSSSSSSPASRGARRTAAALGLGSICVVAATSQGCACGSDPAVEATKTGCGADCNTECQPGLPMGLVGAYTSLAKAKDGSIWVAGYNDAVISQSTSNTFLYGDLVVGRYDSGKKLVQWASVDGLPAARTDGTCPESDPKGWRGGETDTGDDVGLWTSIALDGGDHPIVSYYDASHAALKFASFDGTTWASHTVLGAPGSDVGRYSKLLVVDGKPVVAFLVMEKGNAGKLRSRVVLAHGKTAVPSAAGDWALEDAVVDENGPCRASFCDSGKACIMTTFACTATVPGCTPADCGGSGNACVTVNGAPACVKAAQSSDISTYPNALGDYISLASGPQGLGLVVYDRLHGNLVAVSNAGGKWTASILDGESGSRQAGTAVDTGDTGVGASLFITSNNDWHVTYVNGLTEALMYVKAPGGKAAPTVTPVVVDDGSSLDGKPFADGRHIVGDDAFVQADSGGTVTITYQDATAGTLRVASGSGVAGKWTLKAVSQPDRFAGFFPRFVPGETTVANWWRATDKATKDIYGDVSLVTP